ncbi:unnamed protein product [Peronospora belbahrii]|uniref:Saposin B-type domain-containing protein n=1 Tax=Peronospora belbahrii TaxID=622444 RepID=A0AAU9LC66_9STRA|nr:unnamed protein product [Peronospora belbahrii]
MNSLPLVLQRKICSFAGAPKLIPHDINIHNDCISALNFAKRLNEPSTYNLQRLSYVCRTCRNIVEELCMEHETSCVLTLHFTAYDKEEENQIIQKLATDQTGDKLLDLRIVIPEEKRAPWWDLSAQYQIPL